MPRGSAEMVRSRSISWAVNVAAWTLILLSTRSAQADWLPQFTGFTNFGLDAKTGLPSTIADGIVSFGVYNNVSGTWIGDFGSTVQNAIRVLDSVKPVSKTSKSYGNTSGAENLSPQAQNARYVYFYEVANTDIVTKDTLTKGTSKDSVKKYVESVLHDLEVNRSQGTVTGVGFLSKLVFNENGTPVDKKNPQLGPASGSIDTPGDGIPTYSGFQFTGSPFIDVSKGKPENPKSGRAVSDFVKYLWKGIEKKGVSSVVFFTSDSPPGYCPGLLSGQEKDGCKVRCGKDAGDIPCPVPEPTGLVILLSGVPLVGLGLVRLARRRQ